ncbi:hydroxyisourate hydrolase [Actinomadura viridis]|uniref:5-hydroxyisourate hydrolase n=1 Tax=Actinomadura viridis TaxID=58110 RepID=A0A931DBS3_9ACTN|nr:hydroxyisourate hydrolase [Actinomadura viridis]MBG6088169.1 5-hydroxyisourate hydrolase [Actinomadura viridis]
MTASSPESVPAPEAAPGHVSTHVLDTHRGLPAAEVPVRLDAYDGNAWQALAEGMTDADGRWSAPQVPAAPGTYRLRFGTGPYFAGIGVPTFYPEVSVIFTIAVAGQRHHVPLLLSPYGYSTYRGS